MHFDAQTPFPVQSHSISLAYSSHFLEHVLDDVVDQVLSQIFRCLQPGGEFVLKIPDFDYFLAAYLANEAGAFEDLGVEEIRHTWAAHGVPDTLSSRFCMMLCGYMNEEYGPHFVDSPGARGPGAYHGPPRIADSELRDLIEANSASPHALAAALRARALEEGDVHSFNHQNAWSKAELNALLERHGFEVCDWSQGRADDFRGRIRDLDAMSRWTLFTLARRPGD